MFILYRIRSGEGKRLRWQLPALRTFEYNGQGATRIPSRGHACKGTCRGLLQPMIRGVPCPPPVAQTHDSPDNTSRDPPHDPPHARWALPRLAYAVHSDILLNPVRSVKLPCLALVDPRDDPQRIEDVVKDGQRCHPQVLGSAPVLVGYHWKQLRKQRTNHLEGRAVGEEEAERRAEWRKERKEGVK